MNRKLSEKDLVRQHSLVGTFSEYANQYFKEHKIDNIGIYSSTDEREFKRYYTRERSYESWYNSEIHEFILHYDLSCYDGVEYKWLINYLDRLIKHNYLEPDNLYKEKVRIFKWKR